MQGDSRWGGGLSDEGKRGDSFGGDEDDGAVQLDVMTAGEPERDISKMSCMEVKLIKVCCGLQ